MQRSFVKPHCIFLLSGQTLLLLYNLNCPYGSAVFVKYT